MDTTTLPRPDAPPSIEEKVSFLASPRAYPEGTAAVSTVETHMSWVFLTDRHAYKLKKPLRLGANHLETVIARERQCRAEIAVNRRLAADVYLGVVPLRRRPHGGLRLAGEGEAVDWLVWMRRLPADRMLDARILARSVSREDIARFMDVLAAFYASRFPEPMTGPALRAHLAARIASSTLDLGRFTSHVRLAFVEEIGERQVAFLERRGALFDARVAGGHCVEGHGDLRPEHVCLEAPPRIIDALDFSRELRIVDPVEELGFLALQCERLGAAWIGAEVFARYEALSGDSAPPGLVDFYQSCHACVRAKLALRHLLDERPRDPARWPVQANDYLRLAARHIDRAAQLA